VLWQGRRVAEIASGTQSPSLGCGIGMAYLPIEAGEPGTAIEVELAGATSCRGGEEAVLPEASRLIESTHTPSL